jgi:hypothetical protein
MNDSDLLILCPSAAVIRSVYQRELKEKGREGKGTTRSMHSREVEEEIREV